jgi:hypothetical protein
VKFISNKYIDKKILTIDPNDNIDNYKDENYDILIQGTRVKKISTFTVKVNDSTIWDYNEKKTYHTFPTDSRELFGELLEKNLS